MGTEQSLRTVHGHRISVRLVIVVMLASLVSVAAYATIPSIIGPMVFSGPVASGDGPHDGGSRATPPLQISHQGVVAANGQRFNGDADFRFALVDPDTDENLWTNDGTQVSGPGTPTAAVILPVIDGLFNVRLGDTSLANMTAILSPVFLDDNMVLRVWFDDGTHGIQQLLPDHPLTSAGYAHHAVFSETSGTATFATAAGDADTVDGVHASELEESQEIIDAITAHGGDPSIHHARYTDAEAVAAVFAAGVTEGPVGAVVAWLLSFPNVPALPDGWVECNGQTISDPASPLNGQAVPDLNGSSGTQRFLRGSTSSGTTGGSESHSHLQTDPGNWGYIIPGGPDLIMARRDVQTGNTSTHPSYYEVVWVMKIK